MRFCPAIGRRKYKKCHGTAALWDRSHSLKDETPLAATRSKLG